MAGGSAIEPLRADHLLVKTEFLATATASALQRRLALGLVLFASISFFAGLPFATVKLARFEAFIPAYDTALFVIDLVTVVLLLGQFVKLRSRAILALMAGYLFSALVVVPHAL